MKRKGLSRERALEIVAEAEGFFEDARDTAVHRFPEYNENMLFYRGRQWAVEEGFGTELDAEIADEEREVENYVRPFVRSATAALLKNFPKPDVVGNDTDQRSHARALAAFQLARSFVATGVLAYDELRRACISAVIQGAAWFKVYWDPNAGQRFDTPAFVDDGAGNLEADTDDFGEQRYETAFEGEVACEFVDIYDALVDPHAKRLAEVRHIVHRKLLPRGKLEDIFPEDFFGKATEGRFTMQGRTDGRYERDMAELDMAWGVVSTKQGPNDLCELVEFWERPSNTWPRGRLIVWVGDVVLAVGSLPNGRWPWVFCPGPNVVPGRLYPEGLVVDLKGPQRTINFTSSKVKEWVRFVLNSAYLVPREAELDTTRITDVPGDILLYNAGYKPEQTSPPPIPSSMFTLNEAKVGTMKDIAGDAGITAGDPPPGLESGRALAYLNEFQQTRQLPEAHAWKQCLVEVLKAMLLVARDHYEEGRLVRILGDDDAYVAKAFASADYDFDAHLVIDPFSALPDSRAVRQAEVMEAFTAGLFADTPEAKAARRMLNMDSRDRSTTDPNEGHRRRALREQLSLVEDPYNASVSVAEYDQDDIHLDCHDAFRVSAEYEGLPPEARAHFDEHCAMHEQQRAQKYQVVAQEQMLLGAGSGKGGPPPAKAPGAESPMNGGHAAAGAPMEDAPPDLDQPSGPPPTGQGTATM